MLFMGSTYIVFFRIAFFVVQFLLFTTNKKFLKITDRDLTGVSTKGDQESINRQVLVYSSYLSQLIPHLPSMYRKIIELFELTKQRDIKRDNCID